MQQEAPPSTASLVTAVSSAAERSAAHILMELNHNYMKMESADSRSKEVVERKELESPQQPKEQQKNPPFGVGNLCFEPYSKAVIAAKSPKFAASSSIKSRQPVIVSRIINSKYIVPPQSGNFVHIRPPPASDGNGLTNFQSQQPIFTENSSISNAAQKRTAVRDPLSHRLSEKRRRERFNTSLADLRDLVPKIFVSKTCQNKVRLEKTEVINAAIEYIKHLKSQVTNFGAVNKRPSATSTPSPKSLDISLQQQFIKTDDDSGFSFSDHMYYTNNSLNLEDSSTASDLLQDLSSNGSCRARNPSCASSVSSFTLSTTEEQSYSSPSTSENSLSENPISPVASQENPAPLEQPPIYQTFVLDPSGTYFMPFSMATESSAPSGNQSLANLN